MSALLELGPTVSMATMVGPLDLVGPPPRPPELLALAFALLLFVHALLCV